MITIGQEFKKKLNGLIFIVTDVVGNSIHFQEKNYLNTKIMDKKSFIEMFEII